VEAVVVNARFVKPVDGDLICSLAEKAGCLITVEENVRRGGFGEAVRDEMHERGLGHVRHKIIALPDGFVEHGTQALIRADCGLDAKSVAREASILLSSARV
jgi:1-deoxy-D-xylulose-5-phosphate synthase